MRGELAVTELERWYAARGWPTETGGGGLAAHPGLWLLTGGEFDVVEVPEQAGRQATVRLLDYGQAALRPGPVGLTGPGRCGFLVAPGAMEDLPELLEWLDWGGIELGIRAYGRGDRVPAPAPEDWLHDPSAPAPEVIALLATIAQACWLERLGRSVPPVVPAVRLGAPRRAPGKVGAEVQAGPAAETAAVRTVVDEAPGTAGDARTAETADEAVRVAAGAALAGPGAGPGPEAGAGPGAGPGAAEMAANVPEVAVGGRIGPGESV